MARRTAQGVVDGGSTLPSGTAQPDLRPYRLGGTAIFRPATCEIPLTERRMVLYATRPKTLSPADHDTGRAYMWEFLDPLSDGSIGYARFRFSYASLLPEAAGRPVFFEGMSCFRFRDGLIAHYKLGRLDGSAAPFNRPRPRSLGGHGHWAAAGPAQQQSPSPKKTASALPATPPASPPRPGSMVFTSSVRALKTKPWRPIASSAPTRTLPTS